jgi:two-component system phosphate regulon sensor histidine kinase PhoR
MSKSLFPKVCGWCLVVILLLSTLILLFSFNTIRYQYTETLTDRLQNAGIALRPAVVPLLDRSHADELVELVADTGKESNLGITVIDAHGVVLADSQDDPEEMENHKARPEVVEARSGQTGHALRSDGADNQEMLYAAIPLRKNGRAVGALRTSLSLMQIENLLFSLKIDIINKVVTLRL